MLRRGDMKKVRVVIGAAAIAPAALAMAGGPAGAATPHHGRVHTNPRAKSVRTVRGTAHGPHAAPNSSNSVVCSNATHSTNTKSIPPSNGYQVFWWKSQESADRTCIGTVKRHFSYTPNSPLKIRFRIFHNSGDSIVTYSHTFGSGVRNMSWDDHHWYPYLNLRVCTAVRDFFNSTWVQIVCGKTGTI